MLLWFLMLEGSNNGGLGEEEGGEGKGQDEKVGKNGLGKLEVEDRE